MQKKNALFDVLTQKTRFAMCALWFDSCSQSVLKLYCEGQFFNFARSSVFIVLKTSKA